MIELGVWAYVERSGVPRWKSISPRVREVESVLRNVGKVDVTNNIYGAKWTKEVNVPTPCNEAVVEVDRQINNGLLKMDRSNFELLKERTGGQPRRKS